MAIPRHSIGRLACSGSPLPAIGAASSHASMPRSPPRRSGTSAQVETLDRSLGWAGTRWLSGCLTPKARKDNCRSDSRRARAPAANRRAGKPSSPPAMVADTMCADGAVYPRPLPPRDDASDILVACRSATRIERPCVTVAFVAGRLLSSQPHPGDLLCSNSCDDRFTELDPAHERTRLWSTALLNSRAVTRVPSVGAAGTDGIRWNKVRPEVERRTAR
jgi:hypothetical protein